MSSRHADEITELAHGELLAQLAESLRYFLDLVGEKHKILADSGQPAIADKGMKELATEFEL